MIDNPYYSQENHGPYKYFDLGDFSLEDGGIISDCKIAYSSFGELNEAKNNAILIPTWYAGTNKIIEEAYIGPGRALDPENYFLVCVNQIGNGLSSSPHNVTNLPSGTRFPNVRIGDDVRAQHRLVTELFQLESLALVVGGSMGAQQTYEWACRYPDMVKRAAPIAGTAKNSDHDFLFTQSLIEAITSDPNWQDGAYSSNEQVAQGLKRHAGIWAVMGLSTEFYQQQLWRSLGFDSLGQFRTEFLEATFLTMDPSDLLCMAWKWQRGDVSRLTDGDLSAALSRITAKMFVMPIDEDMFFPPRDCEREQNQIANSELRILKSAYGHLALFGTERQFLDQVDANLQELLSVEV
ncbi:MAG: homoserine O-acetyltransferase [Gammaproteobacteria bacterium]|jgi:homoserine O-acetyltransferase